VPHLYRPKERHLPPDRCPEGGRLSGGGRADVRPPYRAGGHRPAESVEAQVTKYTTPTQGQ